MYFPKKRSQTESNFNQTEMPKIRNIKKNPDLIISEKKELNEENRIYINTETDIFNDSNSMNRKNKLKIKK